jgi:antitoxin component YwqK of YwqJK toxin-antitoxin module
MTIDEEALFLLSHTKVKEENIEYWINIEGKKDGEYKLWWDDGKLRQHCFYKDGKEEGEYKEYYHDGKLYKHCFYKDGKEDGEYKELDEETVIEYSEKGGFKVVTWNGTIITFADYYKMLHQHLNVN